MHVFKLEWSPYISKQLSLNSIPPPLLSDVPESIDRGEETMGTHQSDTCASQEVRW